MNQIWDIIFLLGKLALRLKMRMLLPQDWHWSFLKLLQTHG